MIKVKERVVGSRETEMKNAEQVKEDDAENVILRWEKFVAKMDIRVLLVEADDSTTHIITALLKKCSYKVDAVSDGLEAWEILNRRSHDIDLILTEVEVPSISGFSLLTLVTEHEVCRNIPVIMMSAHDSVSTVYNCMLKGAADFLVKPIRKNELNNLWQHVWRRQASSSGQAQTVSDAQQMVEVAAEKDAFRNYSSGYDACCIERNRECIQKGSDSQSSCSLQDSETKKACPEYKHIITQLKQRKSPSDVIIQKDELEKGSERESVHDDEAQGSASVPKANSEVLMLREHMAADSQCEHANISTKAFDYANNIVQDKSSTEAIDLIGTFNTYPECSYRSLESSHGLNKLDSSFLLELSLNLSYPRDSINQVIDEGHMVKQSEASAFSRYNGKTSQTLHKSSDSMGDQQRGYETNFDKQLTHQAHEYSSGNCCPTISHNDNMISPTSDRLGIESPHPQQVIPVTGPVKCASFERVCNVYANLAPPLFCTQQSSQSPLQSSDTSGNHKRSIQVDKNCAVNSGIRNSQKILQYLMDQNVYSSSALMEYSKSYESELSNDQVHFPSVSNQHGSGASCNGISNCINSTNNGSNGTSHAFEHVKVAAEDGNEANLIDDEKLNRSIQREAALAKFRMKRKERCFDKKVRYQSRSKLAVQRPRVKGQFVRQVLTEAIEVETDEHDS